MISGAIHLCVDMQSVFREKTPWHMEWMPRVLPQIEKITTIYSNQTVFTRFIPAQRSGEGTGTWRTYYERWSQMTIDNLSLEMLNIVPELAQLAPAAPVIDKHFYGPWLETDLHQQLRVRNIDMEAHSSSTFAEVTDRAKQTVKLESDRPHVLREMMQVCRPAGILSIPGVYGGISDKIPFGMVMNKGLTIRTGQTHVNRWTDDLLNLIQEGEIDPSFVITHTVSLEEGPEMYKTFRDKKDGCIKVVMKPEMEAHNAA